MARKRRVFFGYLESLLNKLLHKNLFSLFLLALVLVVTPLLAKPASSAPAAQQLYDAGRYREAITALQQRQPDSDRTQQAIVLSNLSLSYQKLGEWQAATEQIEAALRLLQGVEATDVRAQVLDVQGNLAFTQGQIDRAVEVWKEAAALHTQTGDRNRATLSQINQAQALQQLGLYRPAITLLSRLNTDLTPQADSLMKASTLRTLGETLRVVGAFEQAEQVVQQSLNVAQRLQAPDAIAAAKLSLGNIALANGNLNANRDNRKAARTAIKAALSFYQQAAADKAPPLIRAQAQLNALNMLLDTPAKLLSGVDEWAEAKRLSTHLTALVDKLPPGRASVNVRVGVGRSFTRWQRLHASDAPNAVTTATLLATAVQQATALHDSRAIANATGYLGRLYEQSEQWSDAYTLTQQALNQAQSVDAADLSYRWQWQLGRLLHVQNQNPAAIGAYTEAFNTLRSLRRDLVSSNADVQFSFREGVEPVYRQLVDLLLQDPNQAHLKQARSVLEALQVAELQNFLQSACESTSNLDRVVDQTDLTAAVVYPILLSDRLDVILKLPGQPELVHYTSARLPQAQIVETLKNFQGSLQESYRTDAVKENGQIVYNWLIQPIRAQLEQRGIKTLVFVLDGPLRNIPMSALYDGKHYLVEKYAVSLALGLNVRKPAPLNRAALQVLAASLTDPPAGFEQYDRLANVNPELDQIQQSGVKSTFIRDRAFTRAEFNRALNQQAFQVVHLATHGQFGADRSNTYILAADGEIQVDDLDQLFRSQRQNANTPIEVLLLSACKTAAGNDRAVLGIAGTAVRAGAQSAIAGLWSLADEPAVKFTQTFYQSLGKPNVSRAEALRRAQLALLQDPQFAHPRYWAPYVLVGNWL